MACCCCSTFLLLAFVVVVLLALLLIYSGILHKVETKLGLPYLINKPVKILYKFNRGPYKHAKPFFDELRDSVPEAALIGIYYDDPTVVRATNLRWAVGVIIEVDGVPVLGKNMVERLQMARYKEFLLPGVQKAITAYHPWVNCLSILLAIRKVYKKIHEYSEETTIVGCPAVEIYKDNNIYFQMPVERNEEFEVNEAKAL